MNEERATMNISTERLKSMGYDNKSKYKNIY